MTNRRHCADCLAPVKLRGRVRCHVCHRKAERALLKRSCARCGDLRHLRPGGHCAACTHAAAPRKPPKTISCSGCGQQRRDVGHGLCSRCKQADPDWPFRYGLSLARQMQPAPEWWAQLIAFTAARRYPGGAVAILRQLGRALIADPGLTPHQLLSQLAADGTTTTTRILVMFFTSRGLTLTPDDTLRREQVRQHRYLRPIQDPLSDAVVAYHHAQLAEQQHRRRIGRRTLSEITLTTRLRVLRDLAADLTARRQITGWAEVTTTDLETFIARAPRNRHQQTYVLRGFFAWARGHKLVLTDPARRLLLGAQPAFTGTVLDLAAQRKLFGRWTSPQTPAHERLTGLLALLHAASNAEIRTLTIDRVDTARRTVALTGRPFPTPLDPATWDALQACLRSRQTMRTLNPHVLVTRASSGRDTAADSSYLTRSLAPTQTTPAICRQTRLTQLVTDLDAKLAATALGMNAAGLIRYLADNVARDRLDPTGHRHH